MTIQTSLLASLTATQLPSTLPCPRNGNGIEKKKKKCTNEKANWCQADRILAQARRARHILETVHTGCCSCPRLPLPPLNNNVSPLPSETVVRSAFVVVSNPFDATARAAATSRHDSPF